jgi:hypothetical protein
LTLDTTNENGYVGRMGRKSYPKEMFQLLSTRKMNSEIPIKDDFSRGDLNENGTNHSI